MGFCSTNRFSNMVSPINESDEVGFIDSLVTEKILIQNAKNHPITEKFINELCDDESDRAVMKDLMPIGYACGDDKGNFVLYLKGSFYYCTKNIKVSNFDKCKMTADKLIKFLNGGQLTVETVAQYTSEMEKMGYVKPGKSVLETAHYSLAPEVSGTDIEESAYDPLNDPEYTALDNVAVSEAFGNLEELNIQLLENDNNLFESVISSDFTSHANEVALTESAFVEVQNEATANLIIQEANNCSKIFGGTRNSLKQAAAKTSNKIAALHKSDKAKFKSFTYADLAGFGGLDNFAFPSATTDKLLDKLASFNTLVSAVESFAKTVNGTSDRNKMQVAFASLKTKAAGESGMLNDNIKTVFKSSNTWTPSKKDVAILAQFVKDASVMKKDIASKASDAAKAVKAIEDVMKEICKTASKTNDPEVAYKANLMYSASSFILRTINRRFNMYLNSIVKEYAAYRKAAIVCCKYAHKKTTSTNESMIYNAIAESSDTFVFEQFAY